MSSTASQLSIMNHLFEDHHHHHHQDHQDEMGTVELGFLPNLGANMGFGPMGCHQSLKGFNFNGVMPPPPPPSSSLSSQTANLTEALITSSSSSATLHGGGATQLLSLHRSSSTLLNPWGWGSEVVSDEYNWLSGSKRSVGVGESHGHQLGMCGMKMKKIKGRRKVREPRFCFKTMSDVDVLDDGYKWRKYGQKVVKNTNHPRSYYRCTQDNCRVKKRVERLAEDPRMVITTYEGRHVHSPSNDLDDSQTPHSQLTNFLW